VEAARAAATLEPHLDRIADLPGPAAWAALADLADLATAVPHLDSDLTARLPPGLLEQRAALTDPVPHGVLRLAAEHLTTQLHDLPAGQPQEPLLHAAPARAAVLRSPADLPDGMRRLTAVLDQVGSRIAATDARLVARLLAYGAQTVQQLIRQPGTSPALTETGRHIAPALPALQQLWETQLATLTAPDPRIRPLVTEIYGQLRTTRDRQDLGAALAWLTETGSTARALTHTLQTAGQDARLLTRPGEDVARKQAHLLWLPVPKANAGRHPALVHTRTAATAFSTAGRAAGAALPPAGGVRAAAGRAAGAGKELRAALRQRAGSLPPPAAPRAAHPAHRSQRDHGPRLA
ncbi:MAG TPA: hypothetical protein VNV66_02820, partial [Pilimelia sp.]|nr:hypothetical protein [Pilimelia sp.]